MSQMDLFDLDEGRRQRDEALAAMEDANPGFMVLAMAEIQKLPGGTLFTTDELWKQLPRVPEPRIMGAVMTKGEKLGLIRKVGNEHTPTRRIAAHARPVQIWVRIGIPPGEK